MSTLFWIWAVVVARLLGLLRKRGSLMYVFTYRIGYYSGDGIEPVPGQHDQAGLGVLENYIRAQCGGYH